MMFPPIKDSLNAGLFFWHGESTFERAPDPFVPDNAGLDSFPGPAVDPARLDMSSRVLS